MFFNFDPFEAFFMGLVIIFPEGIVFLVESRQGLHHLIEGLMNRVEFEHPIHLRILMPFADMAPFIAHEEQFFAGMGKEEAIIGPSQVEFVFVVSIHLIDDGEFAMDHLIV